VTSGEQSTLGTFFFTGCIVIPVHLPIQFCSRAGSFIIVVPGEQRLTPNFGSLQATVLVGPRHVESTLEATRCQSRTSVLVQTQNCSRQLERSRSLVVIHTPRLWDDKAPGPRRVATCHLDAHSGDWPSEFARLTVRWYAPEAVNLSAAIETDLGQQLFSEGIETPDGSLFLHVAKLTFDLPRLVHEGGQVGCGIGTIFHGRIHSNLLFLFLRYALSLTKYV